MLPRFRVSLRPICCNPHYAAVYELWPCDQRDATLDYVRHGLRVSEAINFRSERFDLNSVSRVGSAIHQRHAVAYGSFTQYGVGRYPDRSHIF